MKDKASADTQRTEAVNCMVEITGGERRERGRGRTEGDEGRQEQKEGKNVKTDKRRRGNGKREKNSWLMPN